MNVVTPCPVLLTREFSIAESQYSQETLGEDDTEEVQENDGPGKLLTQDFEADVEDNRDFDSDDESAARVEEEEAYAALKKENEKIKRGTDLFARSQQFVPNIYDSDKYSEDGYHVMCEKMADRAGYAAYLKYGWQGRDDLFSVIYQEALAAYDDRIPSDIRDDTEWYREVIEAAEKYANEVCINCVLISQK
jgi:hypothetical protein